MISKEDIQALADLSRITLAPEELPALQADIANILGYMDQIRFFTGETAAKEVPHTHNVMRDDALHTSGSPLIEKREALLAALPRRQGDFAVVRRILQKDE